MDYTPRQVLAFLTICQERRKAELRDQLGVGLLAARGDDKAVRAQMKAWDD